ncbi:hypothetical protein SJAV_03570 [Sulfurisphaera javensis]|uniref:Uncharacterized protein n=1 Tax=Sulfurisphaera javensis TaxID=2049879 RepID=A0AAT9GNX1_9CREN
MQTYILQKQETKLKSEEELNERVVDFTTITERRNLD